MMLGVWDTRRSDADAKATMLERLVGADGWIRTSGVMIEVQRGEREVVWLVMRFRKVVV